MAPGWLRSDVAWATSRARIGLWLGPGSIVGFFLLCLVLVPIDWTTGHRMLPEEDNVVGLLAFVCFLLAVVPLHLFSLTECLATARMLRRRDCPRVVKALAAYWCLMLVPLAWLLWRAVT